MTLRRLLPLLILPLALAACDSSRMPWEEPVPEVPAVTGPPAISPLVDPIEVADGARVTRATAEARTMNEAAFVAEGPGSAWRVEANGDRASYLRPGARESRVQVRRLVYARGVEYVGRLGDAPFALTVLGDACKIAGMERNWPLAARLKSGGKTVEGCAAPAAKAPARSFTSLPPAPAAPAKPAAPKAPAAPKPPAPAPAQPAPTPEPAAAPDTTPTTEAPAPAAPVEPTAAPEAPAATPAATEPAATTTPPVILPVPAPVTEAAPAATAGN